MAGLSDSFSPPTVCNVSVPSTKRKNPLRSLQRSSSRRGSIRLTLGWVAQHVRHMDNSAKLAGLQIRTPKLSTEEDVKPLTPMEGIQWVLLAVSHRRIAEQLRQTTDISASFMAILTIWGFFMAGIDYGSRFGDGDLYHRFLWATHTLGLYGVMIHVDALAETWEKMAGLMVSLAGGYCVMAILGLGRVAWYLQDARRYCLVNGSFHVLRAILYLACLWPSTLAWRKILLWTSAILYIITAFISRLMFRLTVPANVTYTLHKVTGLWAAVLGSVLVDMAIPPQRMMTREMASSYTVVLLGFAIFLFMKVFLIDTDEIMPQDHTLRRSGMLPGCVWLCICPLCTVGVVGMASGCRQLLECTLPDSNSDEADNLWAKQLMNSSLGLLVLTASLQRWLHRSIVRNDALRQMLMQTLIAIAAFLLNFWETLPALLDEFLLALLALLAVLSGYWDGIRYLRSPSLLPELSELPQ